MRILETVAWDDLSAGLSAQASGAPSVPIRGASIDTRSLEPGDLFFALKGERTDGHDHLEAAKRAGAAAAVVRDPKRAPRGLVALTVEDPEQALFDLGRLIRARSTSVFVAITGSAGKTTAKDFTAELLAARGPVLKTRGNLNNHLGVPLTLARLETDHWAAVIECGMSRAGEMSRLAGLVRPRVAAVTNVAAAHLEFFDSVDGIAAAKSEIFEPLGAGDTAVAPAGEPRLAKPALATPASVILFGDGPQSKVRAEVAALSLTGSTFQLAYDDGSRVKVALPVPGAHSISNFLAAAAMARAVGIPIERVAERAGRLAAAGNRGQVKRLRGDILLIDDTYNSNPTALRAAATTLALARPRRLVACVGDMLELGPTGPELHREAGADLASRVDLLLAAGTFASDFVAGASALAPAARAAFPTSEELASRIGSLVNPGDAVLIKGSRGARMEKVAAALLAAHPEASV